MRYLTTDEIYSIGRPSILNLTECKSNYRGRALYVLEFEDGVKIGVASNICHRIKNYRAPWIRPIKRQSFFKCLNPLTYEHYFKNKYRKFTKEGSTEFFHHPVYDEIINFLKSTRAFRSVKNISVHVAASDTLEYDPNKFKGLSQTKKSPRYK